MKSKVRSQSTCETNCTENELLTVLQLATGIPEHEQCTNSGSEHEFWLRSVSQGIWKEMSSAGATRMQTKWSCNEHRNLCLHCVSQIAYNSLMSSQFNCGIKVSDSCVGIK
eukprot:Gregarina_sp_Poly_1__2294@NODE_1610_length_3717_cov_281_889863_g1061_i0_p3_GENE_NODE_1610_length_3717_cov_281_889863_g1061_i0NODE_1610_length_3717_cov_281_889863_g1061_i0_p3_ORF_typecomplete_len111_score14_58_NODE_1610_length_3717_cov_281_889863_g1061_i018292161